MANKASKSAKSSGEPVYLSAKEAAAELSVSLATLYAYVSRDLIRSEPVPDSRAHRYRAEDVRALKQRRAAARQKPGEPEQAFGALSFGLPVLDSAITLIADGKLYYRGSDAAKLAEASSLEQVAALLWGIADYQPFDARQVPVPSPALDRLLDDAGELPPVDRCLAALPVAAKEDPGIYNKTDRGLAATGARLMRLIAGVIARSAPSADPVHNVLARAFTLGDQQSAHLVRAALVLCADHELNTSAFTVRCVAGTGATLYAAVAAGICAAQGPRHGGVTGRVERLLTDLGNERDVEGGILRRLRDNEAVPGFGHPLYTGPDPRATALLAMIERAHGEDRVFQRAAQVIEIMDVAGGLAPNVDFAVGTLAAVWRLPEGAALSLFVLGRTAGWIGHAIEQYRSGAMIRPRARYVGETPR